MLKKFLKNFKSLDTLTHKIMYNGLKFCFAICILSIFILLAYSLAFTSPSMYYIGINLFKLSLIFAIEFVVCGFIVDGIKKQLI